MKENSSLPYKYKRVLLKVSGEALMGRGSGGIDPDVVDRIAADIAEVSRAGAEVCLVVGGGNIFRGVAAAAKGMDRAQGDYAGMLATVINALMLQNALEKNEIDTRVMTAIHMSAIAEPYIRRRALMHLEKGRVVIFGAGTGNPFFTTDTAAALRASEMECDVLLKGTQVDGVYSEDPHKNPEAVRYETLSYIDVLSKSLKVMDAAAISLARENKLPIVVFDIHEHGSFSKTLRGQGNYTVISE